MQSWSAQLWKLSHADWESLEKIKHSKKPYCFTIFSLNVATPVRLWRLKNLAMFCSIITVVDMKTMVGMVIIYDAVIVCHAENVLCSCNLTNINSQTNLWTSRKFAFEKSPVWRATMLAPWQFQKSSMNDTESFSSTLNKSFYILESA